MEIVKLPVIRIGGSKGIRIPKKVLDECRIGDSVIATVDHGSITLAPDTGPRDGWERAAREIHSKGEDTLLIGDLLDIDKTEWEW